MYDESFVTILIKDQSYSILKFQKLGQILHVDKIGFLKAHYKQCSCIVC